MMMNNLGKIIVFFVLSSNAFAEVTAYLNQNTSYEGDTITLYIENTMNNEDKPDLSVLNKDFIVQGAGTHSQINILNGQRSFKKTWTIELQPKQKGQLVIPSIMVGKEKTQPINIQVTTLPPEMKEETRKHVFMETSIGATGTETYVQQQIPYTVKLYFDSSMTSGQISQPSVENAVVEELNAKRYKLMRGGKRYTMIEKHFMISPEKSGKLHIPATIVSGRIALSKGAQRNIDPDLNNFFSQFGNDPFFNDPYFTNSFGSDFFNRRASIPTQAFSIKSKTIDVDVLPVPKSFTGSAWLPAEEVNVRDSWTRSPPELKVGEPVTRTLVIRAKGLSGSQIPVINVPKPETIKIYPGQPSSKTHTDGVTLIGRQYLDISYIPQKAGKITIPEIKIDWWNIKTKKQETVTLPAWHLNVLPGVLTEAEKEEPQIQKDTQSNTQDEKITAPITSKAESESDSKSTSSIWAQKKIIVFSIAAIWVLFEIFSAYIKYYRERSGNKKTQVNTSALKEAALLACNKNDKQAAAQALLQLVQAQWNNYSIQNLGKLATQLKEDSTPAIAAIKELEESLYSPSHKSKQWKGDKLKVVIEAGMEPKQSTLTNKTGALEPLYPV